MNTRVGKWGNSLAVRIPGTYVKELGLTEGAELEVTVVDGGMMFRARRPTYTLDELLKQIKPEHIHGEADWGPVVGREAW